MPQEADWSREAPAAATAMPQVRRFSLARVRGWSVPDRFLAALLLLYLAKQLIYVFVFPPFTGHDEVAHYGYLRVVSTETRLPIIPDLQAWRLAAAGSQTTDMDRMPDDLWHDYCRFATGDWYCEPLDPRWADGPPRAVNFLGNSYPTGWIYTANHPPLYYVLMTPVYWLTDRWSPELQHYALRLAAIPFGVATVVFAALLARRLFPGDTFLAITVPAFVALQTQVSYEAAMVNNDILAIALTSWAIYLLVLGIRDGFPLRLCAAIGVALGLGLLAKGTTLTVLPVVALAIIFGVGWRRVRKWLGRGGLVATVAAAVASPWYLFLYRTYGDLGGMERVSRLQEWWNFYNEVPPTIVEQLFNANFALARFRETWGEFGWRVIHLSPELLWGIGLPLAIATIGLLLYPLFAVWAPARRWADPVLRPQRWQVVALAMLVATCIVAYVAVLEFGTRFELTQARYYFPAINAAALLVMLGFRTVIPYRLRAAGQAAIFAWLVAINVLIFVRHVVPYWQQVGL